MFDQSQWADFDGARRIHEQQVTGGQLDTLAVLGNLAMTAALADQKAILFVVVIGVGLVALDQPGIGTQSRQRQAPARKLGDLANEQRAVVGQFCVEMTTGCSQIPGPGFQPVLRRLMDAHGALHNGFLFLLDNS